MMLLYEASCGAHELMQLPPSTLWIVSARSRDSAVCLSYAFRCPVAMASKEKESPPTPIWKESRETSALNRKLPSASHRSPVLGQMPFSKPRYLGSKWGGVR